MKATTTLLALLLGTCVPGFATEPVAAAEPQIKQPGSCPMVVRAFYSDRSMVDRLSRWTEPWEVREREGWVLLAVDLDGYTRLIDEGFRVEIDVLRSERLCTPPMPDKAQTSGIPAYPCYRTVEESLARAAELVGQYPQLATVVDVGDSWEKATIGGSAGYDMTVLKLTNASTAGTPAGAKPRLLLSSAIHAREYTTAELSLRFAERLLSRYDVDADATWLLDEHEIHLMLFANPDGRKHAEDAFLWRKNTNENYCGPTSSSRGADLNRNFEYQWGCCGGSSGSQCDETYRGPSPVSEPEVAALEAYARAIFPDQNNDPLGTGAPTDATGVYIDLHSHGRLVLWPWGFTADPAPNATALQTLGRKLAFFNAYDPSQAIGLYPTDGTTDDFAYADLGVAAFTFELGTDFFQSCPVFEQAILEDNLAALAMAAKVARTPYLTPAGPEILDLALAGSAAVDSGAPLLLGARVDDTRFASSGGTEASQNIVAARFFLDLPPWDASAPAAGELSAADGAFDSPSELVSATLSSAGLALGRHTLYLQGEDAAGGLGPVSAAFFWVVDPATAPRIEGGVIAADTGLPVAATVSSGPFSTTTDPASGAYSLRVPAGSHQLTARSNGYAPVTHGETTVADGEVATVDLVLPPMQQLVANDGESGPAGWEAEPSWALSSEMVYSGNVSWSDSPGGQYAAYADSALNSPSLDLSERIGIRLSYVQRFAFEAHYDFGFVEISIDGGTSWSSVAGVTGSDTGSWEPVVIELPQLDRQPAARIRFRIESDSWLNDDGWHIDDIVVEGGAATSELPLFADNFELGDTSRWSLAVP